MHIARENGQIVGVYTQKQAHTTEILPADNAEVVAFLNKEEDDNAKNEKKINKRIRKLAIDSLKGDGGLPNDYEDIRAVQRT